MANTLQPLHLADLVDEIASGRRKAETVVSDALAAIRDRDGAIHAFERLAPEESIARDFARGGPLAGVPIGVKDIFDTADMATEQGSPIHLGHRPVADAALVAMARAAGAVVMGKTVTTEFASLDPAKTENPAAPGHTPGGSSSGSAAAVAAGLVAGAFGSQTGGSVVRPASYCGVAGFKPSFRLLPTVGMKTFAWTLDTAGLFAARVKDVALFAALLTGRDLAVAPLADGTGLRVGLYRSALDTRIDPEMQGAWERGAEALERTGARILDVAEPAALASAREAHRAVQGYEASRALMYEHREHAERLGPKVKAILDEGATVTPADYDIARRAARVARTAATALFESADVLLLPSAFDPAPRSLASTGDPTLNKLWTLTGNPVISVPGLTAADGRPLGLSVITRFGRDRLALRTADLLERSLR